MVEGCVEPCGEVAALESIARADRRPVGGDREAGIVAEQPYTWLFYMDIVYGVNDRVKGTRIDTYGHYQNLHEWWIPLAYQNAAGDAASR